jgi:hypothetical protein
MFLRVEPMRVAMVAVAWLLSITNLPNPAPAQQVSTPREVSTEIPWIGCWELIVESKAGQNQSSGERHTVCVEPTVDPRALDLTGRVDDEIVVRQLLVADGIRRPVGDANCKGWKMTLRSADGRRLYLQSDTTCVDGTVRHMSGISLLAAANHWLDIQVLRQGTKSELAIRHYRLLGSASFQLPASGPATANAARMMSVTRPTANDVVEALGWVDPLVVEAMLLESETGFTIDSRVLVRLAELQVPERIIDLMVALSFPDYFTIEGQAISRTKETYYGDSWSPWYPRYGYGFGYFDHYYWYPPVAAPPWSGSGGKVVSGRGYTQVQRNQRPSGGLVGLLTQSSDAGGGSGSGFGSSGSAGGSASGSASSSGYRSSGSSSGSTRPAVHK